MSESKLGKSPLDTNYVPIDCSIYAKYELSILHGESIRVCWVDRRNQHHVETLMPFDLRTRWHSEFMVARNQEGTLRILRLDQILSANVIGQSDS